MAALTPKLRSFSLMTRAIRSKQSELLISLIMVLILLLFASIFMFFLEHEAQPKAFSSIPATMWWGVATLTTVGYGDIFPITMGGKILGGVIAILGVGLFALPAGIIASGFMEEIEKDKERATMTEIERKLKHAFFVEYFVPVSRKKKELGLAHIPRKWLSLNDIKYKMGISEDSVIGVVAFSKLFRLRNVKINGLDHAGLEYIDSNRSYGQSINRQSKLSFVNLYAAVQPYFGHFTSSLAEMLQANYISNEQFGKVSLLESKQLNTLVNEAYGKAKPAHPALAELRSDLLSIVGQGKTCVLFMNAANNDNLVQFNTGAAVGESGFEEGPFFKDHALLEKVFAQAQKMAEAHEMKALKHENNGNPDPNHVAWFLHKETDCNLVMVHVNVGILKKKAAVYYQFIDEFAQCLALLK